MAVARHRRVGASARRVSCRPRGSRVEPDRVELELDLTPGIAVADATIADIDRDRDGVLSADEKRAYRRSRARRRRTRARRPAAPRRARSVPRFPTSTPFGTARARSGSTSAVALPPQADGDHQLSFRNMDQRDGSVYLANALVPRSESHRDRGAAARPAQRELTIDYVLRPGRAASTPVWLMGGLAGVAVLAALFEAKRRPRPRREPVQL